MFFVFCFFFPIFFVWFFFTFKCLFAQSMRRQCLSSLELVGCGSQCAPDSYKFVDTDAKEFWICPELCEDFFQVNKTNQLCYLCGFNINVAFLIFFFRIALMSLLNDLSTLKHFAKLKRKFSLYFYIFFFSLIKI